MLELAELTPFPVFAIQSAQPLTTPTQALAHKAQWQLVSYQRFCNLTSAHQNQSPTHVQLLGVLSLQLKTQPSMIFHKVGKV
jgi:hypothetical protein